MWIQPEFLSISLLTPNAQRQNVLLKKKTQKLRSSVVKDVVKHSGVIIFFVPGLILYSLPTHWYVAKNGTDAGSFLQL